MAKQFKQILELLQFKVQDICGAPEASAIRKRVLITLTHIVGMTIVVVHKVL